jgi:hypothetical protein
MAATGSIVETFQGHRSVRMVSLAWTSAADGTVSGIPTQSKYSGELLRVDFAPGAGDVQPTNLYSATLTDEAGLDVLAGLGANLSNANGTSVCPLIGDGTTTDRPVAIDGNLTLAVSAAGDGKAGTVKLYFR